MTQQVNAIEAINDEQGNLLNKYIASIVQKSNPYRHKFYKQTVIHAEQMGVHIEGFMPILLLKQKRPNEPEIVREYRLQVWKSVTKSQSEKILNTVSRIFNRKFFRIEFPENPSIVPEEESLGYFLNEDYGIYRSLWIFIRETLLKITFSDPNAVCMVFPQNINAEGSEFYEPLPIIYRSKNIVDFVDGEYFTIYVPDENAKGVTKKREPGKLLIVTKESIRVWVVKDNSVTLVMDFQHDLGVVPAFRIGGQVEGDKSPYYYSSFVAGVQPHWDKAITMISDADGSIVNHLFPERYEWQDSCGTCGGTGKIQVEEVNLGIKSAKQKYKNVKCRKCDGTGWVTNKSPYGIISLKRDALNPDLPPPTPPAAYITKDIQPLTELKKYIAEEIQAGFSAINMDILDKVGENQSGVAKTIDRQDMDSFLMRISNHVFDYQVKNIIELTARWRYSEVLSPQQLEEFVGDIVISKPKEFSVLSMDMLVNELKTASTSNVSSNYIKQVETELINNKFSNNEEERKKNLAIIRLKPFPNKTIDQLMSAKASNAIRERDLIRNENIDELVEIAVDEQDDFLDMSFSEQLQKINEIIDREYISEPVATVPVQEDEEIEEEEENEDGDLDEEEEDLEDIEDEDEEPAN